VSLRLVVVVIVSCLKECFTSDKQFSDSLKFPLPRFTTGKESSDNRPTSESQKNEGFDLLNC